PYTSSCSCSFYGTDAHRDLPSFPTRRSSDLLYAFMGLSPVWADDTEIYFGNPGAGATANILFILDTSGSMTADDDSNGTSRMDEDRKSTRLNSSHVKISYAVFCLKKKKNSQQ